MNNYGSQNLPFLFIINFDGTEGIVVKLEETMPNQILYKIDGNKNYSDDISKIEINLAKYPESYEKYLEKFNTIYQHLHYGNSYLINLTCQTKIDINLSLEEIFYFAKAKYKLLIRDKLVCFSPECFINIIDNKIYTYPMKGTISTKIPNALQIILEDEKELAEHNTIVDLLRNDLAIISENVRVNKFRYPSYIKTKDYELIQLSSEICGQLPNNYTKNIGDIIAKILPAGSVTGAPKQKTVQIIKDSEAYNRNFYTGVFGIFQNGNIQSAVAIRYIEQIEGELYFKSGGGITINSNPKSEYQEMIDKIYVPIA